MKYDDYLGIFNLCAIVYFITENIFLPLIGCILLWPLVLIVVFLLWRKL